jgi:hypothetical protein
MVGETDMLLALGAVLVGVLMGCLIAMARRR